jgi:CBS domain-containing protein
MTEQLKNILNGKDKAVHSVEGNSTVFDAVNLMCRKHVGALLVMQGGVPIGIISERDVMTRVVLRGLEPAHTPVQSVMTREVLCIELSTEPQIALEIMSRRHFRHLPVLSDGRVSGMVSIGDLVSWTLRNREEELRALRDYVSGGYETYAVSRDISS